MARAMENAASGAGAQPWRRSGVAEVGVPGSREDVTGSLRPRELACPAAND
ncbi:hypothetical protein [Saccharopolyspora phatthalungensis]|uniref:Uncharacterized protein n=1 Tax=Saccharopolyspora phatthalungensis TaxID=664693 RepID=A0A840QJU0_9PSEU|nr:hypothetical protein [Saccharopolyspora phatthalungensis]MBB5159648.1 hypothetical protein [Saccharopolyspora phatthalungensis]